MRGDFYQQLANDLETARAEGLFKEERIITSAQQADITVADGSHVINFCANNYLGLANHPELIAAAKVLFVALRTATKSLSRSWLHSWGWKMRFSTLPALMLTVACLKHCWVRKTPLSPTH